jgi:2-dehydropantoate 2-reductase
MACYVGAQIARAGRASVTLTGTWKEALETLGARGIRVEEDGDAWVTPVEAVPLQEAPQADVVLVMVKSPRTHTVASFVGRSMGGGGVAVTVQNGLGNAEALATAVDSARLVVGVTTAGATLLAPGHVRGFLAPTVLGRDGAGQAASIAQLLTVSGLPTAVQDDVDALVWRKLAVNCAINPLSALRGVRNGALLDNAGDRALVESAAMEVEAVASARGTLVLGGYREAALEAARLTAGNRSSMLQDFERRAPTEIEAMNGAVVREGRRLGVPTPTLSRLLNQVRDRETAYRGVAPSRA